MTQRKPNEKAQTRLKVGGCYFLLGYFDEDLRLPSIETYIYLGKNILDETEGDARWYFQEAESFVRLGRVQPQKGRNNDDILAAPIDHLEGFLNAGQLAEVLEKLDSGTRGR